MGDIELYSEIADMTVWSVSECESTLDVLKDLPTAKNKYNALFTFNQTAGKGQFNRKWASQPFKNIALSIAIPLSPDMAANPTLFNMHLSAAVLAALQDYCLADLSIKWPNDIYGEDKKLAGFLMSILSIKQNKFFQLGLGVNINQIKWAADIPNPTSLSILNNQEQDLHVILNGILNQIQNSVETFNSANHKEILGAFNKGLWRRGKNVSYAAESKDPEQGILLGVNGKGQIQLTHASGIKSFHLGEVRLLPG